MKNLRNLGLDLVASRFQVLKQKKMKWKTEYCIWRSELPEMSTNNHYQYAKSALGKKTNPALVVSDLNT